MKLQANTSISAVGIIAEYNPFHNGHAYQLKKALELSKADYCIAAISGDFIQRGGPAIFDKYTRASMALDAGADLVVELPPIFASSSAEDFASCGISLFHALGIVRHLCFGSESGDLNALSDLAELLVKEPEDYQNKLRQYLKEGFSFPQARAASLSSYTADPTILSLPNNTLGIEYLKALKKQNSSIIPLTIQRIGSGYHAQTIEPEQSMASATAIRSILEQNTPDLKPLKSQMPAKACELACTRTAIAADDFSALLSFRLLELEKQGISLQRFLDVSPELAQRIGKYTLDFSTISNRIQNLKTRQYTYTRISRSLFHILLNMTKEDALSRKAHNYLSYIRILGFRKESSALLSAIKKASILPLITKTADAKKILSDDSFAEFQNDLYCSHIYQAVYQAKTGQELPNEYTRSVLIQ